MNTTTTTKCSCGKRAFCGGKCRKCHRAHMDRLHEEARATVAAGVCPCCGTKLVRNQALTGWWQCGAYACEDFRRPEFRGLPSCSFQCFTE